MNKISFTTSTGANTLEYTKLLLRSLKENLFYNEHEIIVFVDGDNDGTADYLRSIKKDFYDLKIVTHKVKPAVGLQINASLLVDLAKHDIVAYLHSDMIISKNYDLNILEDLEDNCILSATRIEPPLHGESPYTFNKDLGVTPDSFNWEEFISFSDSVKSDKNLEYFFAPYIFYKSTWKLLGGYDTRFRRAREDSDFVQRCVQAGIKLKQTFKANVYHFTCVSSRGKNWFDPNNDEAKKRAELQKVADGIEIRRFLQKWGNFNHGESKLNKLDIDLVIKDSNKINPMFISQLEPFFSRVWLKSEEEKKVIVEMFNNEHDPANELLGFSNEDWEFAKKFYNQTDFDSIYKVGEPDKFNIKVEVNFEGVDPKQDMFLQNLTSISSIIEPSEPGIYELGCARIDVQNVISTSQGQIKVENPTFDMSLLTIE